MAWAPTTDQILDLDGVHRRADSWRWDLADRQGRVLGQLAPNLDRPPTIKVDTDANIVRSISNLNLSAAEVNDINPVTDRVYPYMVLQNGAEFAMGEFLWGADSRPERPWGIERASSMVDKGVILDQGLTTAHSQNKGANVIVIAVAFALDTYAIGPEEIIYQDSTATLGAAKAWQPGSVRVSTIRELLADIGYLPPYFDRDGFLIYRDTPDLVTASADHSYAVGPTGRIHANSISENDDMLTAANLFVAYESSGQGAPIVGSHQLPATAPNSIERRGWAVTDVESHQGLTTRAQANKAARTKATTDGRPFVYKRITTTADPRHDVFGIVEYGGVNWLEIAWSMVCRSGGPMDHVIRRVF